MIRTGMREAGSEMDRWAIQTETVRLPACEALLVSGVGWTVG